MLEKVLDIRNLSTSFFTPDGELRAVRNVSFFVRSGEALGIIGESGCGKSTTVLSIMQLLPGSAKIVEGQILFGNENILALNEEGMRKIRGKKMSMIYQDPMTALNPVLKIGEQLVETIFAHESKISNREAYQKALNYLKLVKMSMAEERFNQYPMQLSGGMRQRVVIAMSMLNDPEILIADEPTTALDVTIQAQILHLMRQIQHERQKAIILISHDLGVVAELCSRVLVMYGGNIIEEGTIEDIFDHPSHPYTEGLLNSLPYIDGEKIKETLEPIPGSPPRLFSTFRGCPFSPRCKFGMKLCLHYMPDEVIISESQKVSCFLYYPFLREKKQNDFRIEKIRKKVR